MVSNIHDIASKAQENDRTRCVADCVDVVLRAGPPCERKLNVSRVVDHFRENNLNLLVSDKEGGFVVAPREVYLNKARLAIDKNFNYLEGLKPKVIKAKALQLCNRLDLTQLRKQITAAKGVQLEMFFTAKTHKESCPFRVVVTEKGSWQGAMSRFLLDHLKNLEINDPFLIPNSQTLIEHLKQDGTTVRYGFSLDVEDLFYSVPHKEMFAATSACIENHGTVSFQNQCGISVESFMELLKFYLTSTVVTFNNTYISRKKEYALAHAWHQFCVTSS